MSKRQVWIIERKPLRADESKYSPHERVRSLRLARAKVAAYNRLIADSEYRLAKYVPETT